MADSGFTTVVLRPEARLLNLNRYFTGVPCFRGHLAERHTSSGDCCECVRERRNRRQRETPELMRGYRRKWNQANPEKAVAATQKHRAEHKDRILARSINWKKDNPEKVRLSARKYYAKQREKKAEYARLWRAKNVEKVRAIAKRSANKRSQDPQKRLDAAIRVGICRGLTKGTKNGARSFELLGYTKEQLRAHLETQFKPGMNWDNYGKWHIDHRRPLSLFVYQSPYEQQFKEAWSLDNLQPLWATENQRKGNRTSA